MREPQGTGPWRSSRRPQSSTDCHTSGGAPVRYSRAILQRALFSFLLLLQSGLVARGDEVSITLAGSSTVTRVLLPIKAAVEAGADARIRLLPTGSGRGLVELAAGRADAAMLSGPLDFLLARVDSATADRLHATPLDQLKLARSAKADVVVLLHPSNPLRQLTCAQFRDVLTGRITNWNELGGPDRRIVVVLPDELDGVRATLATGLLDGRQFAATARICAKIAEIPPRVAAEPGALGVVTRGSLAPDASHAELEPTINVGLFLVVPRQKLETNPKLEQIVNSLHSRAR